MENLKVLNLLVNIFFISKLLFGSGAVVASFTLNVRGVRSRGHGYGHAGGGGSVAAAHRHGGGICGGTPQKMREQIRAFGCWAVARGASWNFWARSQPTTVFLEGFPLAPDTPLRVSGRPAAPQELNASLRHGEFGKAKPTRPAVLSPSVAILSHSPNPGGGLHNFFFLHFWHV